MKMFHLIVGTFVIFAVSLNAKHLQPRIYRGENVTIEKAPYQVSVGLLSERHECGGSIISKNYILTAGHCADEKPSAYYVRSGSSFSNSAGQIHSVVEIKLHDGFEEKDNGELVNDIALMKISPAIELNNKTTKIIQLYEDEIKAGDVGYVVGWGLTDKSTRFEPTSQLQGLELKVIDFEECAKDYEFLGAILKNNFCAEHPTRERDFCTGDSGGAFLIKGKQAGIVSYNGPECSVPGQPGVYTNLTKYLDWIKEHMEDS